VDGVFVDNWVQDVGIRDREFSREHFWPSDNGFFFEISKGAICAGNVFVNCDQGIYVLNSSVVQIYNNTLVNSTVTIGRTPRSAENDHFGWHPSTGPGVDERDGHVFMNNLLTADETYSRPLFVVWQTPSLCKRLGKPQLNQLDHNVYVRSSDKSTKLLMLWSPAKNKECQLEFESLSPLRKLHPNFSANSIYLSNYNGPLFKGREVGNWDLLDGFPGIKAASKLPPEIMKLLGISEEDTPFVGAFPVLP
jgi:parallel beta-helix repeat protein